MSEFAIEVNQVSKKYKLYDAPHQRLWEALHPFKKKMHREFWALNEINLKVKQGQTLGIIGRNGSGKSTLLQMIAGVLSPTQGQIQVNGRVSALLELGAGFNPEFTGRENIYFYGTLMGFTRDQMKARFSEIEAFAGIGEFMDQPVKTYSSGMFMRAAFSAAIHVDPDILIVDEALAVGDVQFQSKCYRKFLEFQKQGKTILFVTHDMQTVAKHCDEVILLEGGRVMGQGNARDMIYRYWDLMMGAVEPLEDRISLSESSEKKETQSSEKKEKQPQFEPNNEELKAFLNQVTKQDQCPDRPNYNPSEYRYGSGDVQIVDYLIMVNDHVFPSVVRVGERVEVYLKAVGRKKIQNPTYGFGLRTVDSVLLYGTNTSLYRIFCPAIQPNEQVIYKFTFSVNISPGTYFLGLGVGDKVTGKQDDAIDRRYDLIQFNVESSDVQKQFDGVVHADCQIESLVSVV